MYVAISRKLMKVKVKRPILGYQGMVLYMSRHGVKLVIETHVSNTRHVARKDDTWRRWSFVGHCDMGHIFPRCGATLNLLAIN